jgi:RNA polymerase sigma factor (sigma-70 family)
MAKGKMTALEHTLLWDAFRNGSQEAYAEMYELFAVDLYRYGYNLVKNKELVEDCLHELFLHLHTKRDTLGATNNIQFYMYRSLRRRLTDAVTKQNKFDTNEYVFDNAEFTILPYETFLIEEQTLERQKQLVITELNKLPKRQKEILYLVYMKGLSYQEASEVMDITMKSVYNSINIALTTLRGYLRESFLREGLMLWVLIVFNYFFKILR